MTLAPTETEVPLMGFVGEVLERLGDAVIEVEQCEPRRGSARIDPARTVEVAEKMLAVPNARLATANPPSQRSQEELKMYGVNHAASVSEVRQVVAMNYDLVFGHYDHEVSHLR